MPVIPIRECDIPKFCEECGTKMVLAPSRFFPNRGNAFMCTGPDRHFRNLQPTAIVKVALLDHTGRVLLRSFPGEGRNGSDCFSFPGMILAYGELPDEAVHRTLWEYVGLPLNTSPLVFLGNFLENSKNVTMVHGYVAQPPKTIYSLPRRIPETEDGSSATLSLRGVSEDTLTMDTDRQLLRATRRLLNIH